MEAQSGQMLAVPARAGWADAPLPVWVEMWRVMDAPELARVACVCSRWRAAVRELWTAEGIVFRDARGGALFRRFAAARAWSAVADRLPRLVAPLRAADADQFALTCSETLDVVRSCRALKELVVCMSLRDERAWQAVDGLLLEERATGVMREFRFNFLCSDDSQAVLFANIHRSIRGHAVSVLFNDFRVSAAMLRMMDDILADPACKTEAVDFRVAEREWYYTELVLNFWARVIPRSASLNSVRVHDHRYYYHESVVLLERVFDTFAANPKRFLGVTSCWLSGLGRNLAAAAARAAVVDFGNNVLRHEVRGFQFFKRVAAKTRGRHCRFVRNAGRASCVCRTGGGRCSGAGDDL